jgi:DnaJ-class molecular chaperone
MCDGSGWHQKTQKLQCAECAGKGWTPETISVTAGFFFQQTVSKTVKKACDTCNSKGWTQTEQTLKCYGCKRCR